jgi:uncharacterized protein
MIDLSRLTSFDWDAGNIGKSTEKHHVTPREAEEIFLDGRLLLLADEVHSSAEPRFHAYGETKGGRKLLVSFTVRNNIAIRVISARDMSRKERLRYAEET